MCVYDDPNGFVLRRMTRYVFVCRPLTCCPFFVVGLNRGDQIGGIFAHRVIVYSGQFFKVTKVAHIFGLLFQRLRICIGFVKEWVGAVYILGDFFTNSSGHPGLNEDEEGMECVGCVYGLVKPFLCGGFVWRERERVRERERESVSVSVSVCVCVMVCVCVCVCV
jgi:hypothetical protein